MDTFQAGQIVRFNRTVREFCEDLEVYISEVDDMMSQTFLIVDVFEEELEVEAMANDGSILRLGFHDLEKLNEEV